MASESMLFIPANLGTVRDFNPAIRVKTKGSLAKGEVYLRATLQEMEQILRLCESMEQNHRSLIQETKVQYYLLNGQKKQLEQEDKRRSIFKPLQFLALKRAKQTFRERAEALWVSTIVPSLLDLSDERSSLRKQATSESLRKTLLSISSEDFEPIEDEHMEGNNRVGGIVVPEPPPEQMNTPDTQRALAAAAKLAPILASLSNHDSVGRSEGETRTSLNDEASSSTQSSASAATSPPSSPTSTSGFNQYLNFNLNYTIVNSRDSDTSRFTINNGSENTSGSSTIEHNPSIDSPPPS